MKEISRPIRITDGPLHSHSSIAEIRLLHLDPFTYDEMNGLISLITGGASGLGLACVHRFVKQGASHVHFCDLPGSKGEDIVRSLDPTLVTYHPVDVTDDNAVEQMFVNIHKQHAKLNCLVQCAGVGVAFRCYNINVSLSDSMQRERGDGV